MEKEITQRAINQ